VSSIITLELQVWVQPAKHTGRGPVAQPIGSPVRSRARSLYGTANPAATAGQVIDSSD